MSRMLWLCLCLAGLAAEQPRLDPEDLTRAATELEAYQRELAEREQTRLIAIDPDLPAHLHALEQRMAACNAYLETRQLAEAARIFLELRQAVDQLPEPLKEEPTAGLRALVNRLGVVAQVILGSDLLDTEGLMVPERDGTAPPEGVP